MKEKAVVYLDQNNLFHRYKKLNFVQLLEHIKSKYDVIRATSYNAIDTRDDKQRKFVTYMSNNGWRCQIVDINDNTNVDNIITTDMCSDSNVLDHKVIILISGDGDFNYPLSQLSRCGYKIHIIGVKDNTSLELLKIKDEIDYIENINGVI